MPPNVNKKLQEKVRQDLAQIINYQLNDPRLRMVSVTRVELLQQNQFGTVHWSALGEEGERSKIQKALEHAAGYIQNQLGRRLTTRHTPRLTFVFDPGLAQAIRIGALFNQLEQERAEAAATEAGEDDAESEADAESEDEAEDEDESSAADPELESEPEPEQ